MVTVKRTELDIESNIIIIFRLGGWHIYSEDGDCSSTAATAHGSAHAIKGLFYNLQRYADGISLIDILLNANLTIFRKFYFNSTTLNSG